MKRTIIFLLVLIASPLLIVHAGPPIVTGSIPEGSTTGVTLQVETVPVITATTTPSDSFADIVIDVTSARQHLADQIATSTSDVTVPGVVSSTTELKEYASFLAGVHTSITSLVIGTDEIKLGYELPAKLLFFFPIHYTAVVTIDRTGHLKEFATPGWLGFVQDQAGATKTAVTTATEKLVQALAESTEPAPSLFLLKQKQLTVTLAALKNFGQK